jgi:FeS assembly SUF system protein
VFGFAKRKSTAQSDPVAIPVQDTAEIRDCIIEGLRKIHDPEIPVNIYDLGLIYRLEILGGGKVEVDMTLTAPACPVAGTLPGMVENAIRQVPGVSDAHVELVWDPPWTRDRMSDEAQLQLGIL